MIQSNKLCNAFVPNTNVRSVISAFEIITCREISDHYGGTIIEHGRIFNDDKQKNSRRFS